MVLLAGKSVFAKTKIPAAKLFKQPIRAVARIPGIYNKFLTAGGLPNKVALSFGWNTN